MESKLSANHNSDVSLEDSSGTSNTDSDYSGLSNKSPTRKSTRQELAAQMDELEKMHKDVRKDLEEFSSPRVLFTHTN